MATSRAPFPWLPSRACADRGDARFHLVYPAHEALPPPPDFAGSLRADLRSSMAHRIPDLGVLELSRPLVLGRHGWILSSGGFLLPEQSWYGQEVERMSLPERLPLGTPLPGTSLTLGSDFAWRSYGHYLLDSLSRMHLFLAAGFTLDDVDHVICHRPPTAEAARHFSRLRIPPEKCVWLADGEAWVPERLLAPSFPGGRKNYPPWVVTFLKSTFGTTPKTTQRRLWINRTGRRSIHNAEKVDRAVEAFCLERYDIAAASNPAEDFAGASAIVSPHAGALADLVFCAPGTTVLELLPTDHLAPYYFSLSIAAGLKYRCLICRSLHNRPGPLLTPSTSDFTVDPDEFEAALATIAPSG